MSARTFRWLALAAIFATPASAAIPADGSDDTAEIAFETTFEEFEALPPEPRIEAGVVDLDTFEPPLEPEAATRSIGSGIASYYGRRFHGRRTASGEAFDMHAMTAAHRTLPFGTLVEVTNPRTGQSVTVRINDRGPFTRGRTIDLSRAAASEIGLIQRGHGTVELAIVE